MLSGTSTDSRKLSCSSQSLCQKAYFPAYDSNSYSTLGRGILKYTEVYSVKNILSVMFLNSLLKDKLLHRARIAITIIGRKISFLAQRLTRGFFCSRAVAR